MSESANLAFLTQSRFVFAQKPAELPWADEPCAIDWAREISQTPVPALPILVRHVPAFCFPVEEGMSATEEYRNATQKGILAPEKTPLLSGFAGCPTMYLHPTPAGRVPVIEAPDEDDFIRLYRILACRNEPKPVPVSMGATFISGSVDWARVAWHKAQGMTFEQIKASPAFYKSSYILLSAKGYSGISAEAVKETPEQWREHSMRIRLGHECSHYMTKRFCGSAKNMLHDEIVADYMGLCEAYGLFFPDLFLLFMGLEDFPHYRRGGRLENYLDAGRLDREFKTVCSMLVKAALNIAQRFPTGAKTPSERFAQFEVLCRTTVAQMAYGDFFEQSRQENE